jgi:hypothetical protein
VLSVILSLVFTLGVVAGTVPVFMFLLELIPNFSSYVVPVILIAFGHIPPDYVVEHVTL